MKINPFAINPRRLRRAGIIFFQSAALALVIALAMPARAADDRTIKDRVTPAYPEIAKRLKITGAVTIEATVEADGRVSAVKTISGTTMLSRAAEDAVRKWTFQPGPGKSIVLVQINFNL
ncbi:MAG: energy transducer TonB [Terracidiphilus sp.]|jgi:TonB family protein